MNQQHYIIQFSEIIAKCRTSGFRAEFINNPRIHLLEIGMQLPPHCAISVVEDNDKFMHFIIPDSNLIDSELSTETLRDILAAAGQKSTLGSASCISSFSTISSADGQTIGTLSSVSSASTAGSA